MDIKLSKYRIKELSIIMVLFIPTKIGRRFLRGGSKMLENGGTGQRFPCNSSEVLGNEGGGAIDYNGLGVMVCDGCFCSSWRLIASGDVGGRRPG